MYRDDFRLWLPVDVRWGDMDAFGHVNNAAYFTYCESARIAYFDAVELEQARQAPRHGPALAQASCNFRRQVHYPASLEAGARTSRIGGKSFTLDYLIRRRDPARPDRHDGEVVCDGSSVVVWVDYATGAAIPIPDTLRRRLMEFDRLEAE